MKCPRMNVDQSWIIAAGWMLTEYYIHGLVKGTSSGTSFRYFWYSGSLPHLSSPDFSSRGTPVRVKFKLMRCQKISPLTWEPGDEEVDEDRADDAHVLRAPEHGGAGHVEPRPQHDLPEVVGVAGEGPQPRGDELTLHKFLNCFGGLKGR